MVEKASVRAGPVFDLRGTTQACFENTSIHVNRYLFLSLNFDNDERSARSACHRLSIPTVNIFLRLNLNLTGLCKLYVSLFCNHVLISLDINVHSTYGSNVCTKPKLTTCFGSKYEY